MCPDKTWGFYYPEKGGEIIGVKLVFFVTNILKYFQGKVKEVLKKMGSSGGKGWLREIGLCG